VNFGERLVGSRRAIGVLVFAIALIGAVSSAQAAKNYTLDPVLSLTGSCTTTKGDPVEDPGCPGGKHPPSPFKSPRGVTTDFYGDIYVASFGDESKNGKEGRIDVFNPEGFFITELLDPAGPKDIAVDSKGNLYVFEVAESKIMRYEPSVGYEPEAGKIEYGKPPVLVAHFEGAFVNSLAVTPSNDHLFIKRASSINEYSSAAEGNKLLDESIGAGILSGLNGQGLAVDEAHGRIYAGDNGKVRVFKLAPPHELLMTIEGSSLPPGGALTSLTSVAADEATGDFFIFDGASSKALYEFTEAGEFVATIRSKFLPIFGSEVSVDNGPFSPNPDYLFAPDEESGIGVNFAFEPPPPVCAPEVESISPANVSQEDAELQATINPCGGNTEYVFEYTTQQSFEEEEFAGALVAGDGQIPAGSVGVPVSALASGLSPETAYRFRVVATNEEGADEAQAEFLTYPAPGVVEPCPNDAMRTGLSALLPDCRAYELVTPPDTNARTPRGIGKTAGVYFPTREASPVGEKVSFFTEGGSIPGLEGTGSLSGDSYLATRGVAGWSTASAGPTGAEAVSPLTGSTSPDQGYSFWQSNTIGPAAIEGKSTTYLRYPDGHSDVLGQGSIATDPAVEGELIGENGAHVIFLGTVQLEPNAPPNGTKAIYDRTIDQETGEEETQVVSLLPGNATPAAGESITYRGASLDGQGVAFTIGKKLYLRFNNEETYEIGENVTFAGVIEGGSRIFYVKGGDLFAFDVEEEETIQFTEAGDITPVNVAAEGTAAYFVSPSVLTGEENPSGAEAQAGKENLYLSHEGVISFVGTVTERDVEGEFGATEKTEGLGLWTEAVGPGAFGAPGRFAEDPSRTTPDGHALLFESRAALTGYDPEGHTEVYRYDSSETALQCLSCNPTQAPATGVASLQSIQQELGGPEPFNAFAFVNNLRSDGHRAFFQSTEPLVVGDTDGLQDVYEWEAQGVGTCERPEGCIFLISSGHSDRVDYLYAVSDSGNDVFFRSADLLLPADTERTPSIYDARVGGGFAEEGEACHIDQDCGGSVTPAPSLGAPASEALGPPDNFVPPKKCPKGKHKVTKNGKTSCVKNKKKHHKHQRASSKKKGAGK